MSAHVAQSDVVKIATKIFHELKVKVGLAWVQPSPLLRL